LKIAAIILIILIPFNAWGTLLLQETFDNQSLPNASYATFSAVAFDDTVRQGGSGYSAKFTWDYLDEQPNGINTSTRYTFTATEELYVSFYWRFAADWVGSGVSYHPHLIYILSDEDGLWGSPATSYLDVYIETTVLTPRMIIQDLAKDTPIHGSGSFYSADTTMVRGQWYHVECYFKMNTIGQSDGVMRMWVDGSQVYSSTSVAYRNAPYTNMKFNYILIGPWISISPGNGSPQKQTMWIDSLEVHDSIPSSSTRKLNNVTGVRVTLH